MKPECLRAGFRFGGLSLFGNLAQDNRAGADREQLLCGDRECTD